MFKKPADMKHNLTALVNYAEKDPKKSPDIKNKLRFVAKHVMDNEETLGVVVMLASHGNIFIVLIF